MAKLNALSRAFEKAFAHTQEKGTLDELVSCLGEELGCDRIAIFETVSDGTVSNTHEWCRESVETERDFMQHIPVSSLDTWKSKIEKDEIIYVDELGKLKESDPHIYELLSVQGVNSLIVSKLAFHGKDIGFFMLENPDASSAEDMELVLPGMRYIISSLVYSDRLVDRLERIGYVDSLTGAGNRASLQDRIESLAASESIGIIYCDVMGWRVEDGKAEHIRTEQEYIRAGEVLQNIFEESNVYRVAQHEFLVVVSPVDKASFEDSKNVLKGLFREHDLMVAVGSVWADSCEGSYDAMIRRAHLAVYNDRQILLEEARKQKVLTEEEIWEKKERAKVLISRGDEFFRKAEGYLAECFDDVILTAVVDINYFKLYNDIFGRKAGNLFLERLSEEINIVASKNGGIAGYLGGDNFCLVIPVTDVSDDRIREYIEGIFLSMDYTDGFAPAMGIYISDDRQETMIAMYDRALTALQEIKGDYFEHYRFYDAEHFRHIRDDKLLLMDIKEGLANEEFVFYIQPQVNGKTGKIIGGEALVRWISRGQVISPGRFIPILEKTGYIYAVDCYIWDKVAAWIRSLIDRGIKPVPCSVNVSRVDFYFTDIAEHFIELTKKYDLDPYYLGIEITESSFLDNTELIDNAVKRLHENGFRILMDDFGSGSSSLSMLHTMNLDVLKTDVRFMSRKDADSKAISIVEAVVSMAHMIGMMVITEGVETENQRDNLVAIGDNYVQGFYFYKPMPVDRFEELLADPDNLGETPKKGDVLLTKHLKFREIIQRGMISETLLDNIIGPAAIYRESGGHFRLLQMNEHYSELTGIMLDENGEMTGVPEGYRILDDKKISESIQSADRHPLEGASVEMDFRRQTGEVVHLDMRIFLLYSFEDHKLYLVTVQ